MKRTLAIATILATLTILSACGQKGDLVKPPKRDNHVELHHHAD